MRIRNIKNAKEKISNNDIVIMNPTDYKGKWNTLFCNNNSIMLEIGMGKGSFITKMALANPNINFIGVDRYDSIVLRAYEKALELNLPNLKLSLFDAENIENIFEKDEVERLYLNFSDPWPKASHAKRRLTHQNYLDKYHNVGIKEMHFKTDNRGLFEFSLESINNYGLQMNNISLDLHNSDFVGNIETEYEEKFSKFGPIYRLEANFKNKGIDKEK